MNADFELLRAQIAAKKLAEKFGGARESKFRGLLFPKQQAFVYDRAKRKAAICSRRAGKSTGCQFSLSESLAEPVQGDCAYIGLTRGAAKRIMFNPMGRMNKIHKLGLEGNKSDLTFTHEKTGNTLYMTGASTIEEVEKLRGIKLKKAVIDEAASFRPDVFKYLMDEILEPTTIDMDGDIEIIGTPSANPGDDNLFYRITSGREPGWSVHHWTILDNPHIPHAKKWLEDYRKRKNWTAEHPIYLREWLGQWAVDPDSLVYKYLAERNSYKGLPRQQWNYIIGVDLGFDDAFTICVWAFSYDCKELYCVGQFKKSGLIPSQMADVLKEYKATFKPIRMVGDHGGLGKAIIEEFNQRHSLNIFPAEKQNKLAYIEIFNGDMISGLVKIEDDSPLVKEMRIHQWDPKRSNKEDDRTQNDLCDAALYGFREARHYRGELKAEAPKQGSAEAIQAEADQMLERDMEDFEREQNMAWWEK